MKIVIDIPDNFNNEINTVSNPVIRKALKNGTPLSDNATNGDVIKAMFLNGKYAECKNVIALHTQFFGITCFDKEWWNAPYKAESEER